MTIEPADFENPELLALLRIHLDGMYASSPQDSVNALDLTGLSSPDVSLFVLKQNDHIIAMGALKALDATSGELKSMRTHPDHLRKGAAAALLAHLIGEARRRRYHRLSLETGSGEAFEPALALYRRYGFRNGAVFGDYTATAFNQFLHLALTGAPEDDPAVET